MTQHIRTIIASLAMLLTHSAAWAGGNVIIHILTEGADSNKGGTLTASVSDDGLTCTLVATPAEGYHISAEHITAMRGLDAGIAQSRRGAPDIDKMKLFITAADDDADPRTATTYTLTMPESEYDVEVTADFQVNPTVAEPVIGLESGTYDEAQTLALTCETEGADIYYIVNDGDAQKYNGTPLTISASCSVQAWAKYQVYTSETVTASYIIRQQTTLSFVEGRYERYIGDEPSSPTLNNPDNVEVEWTSSNTKVATVDQTGGLTLLKPGKTLIRAFFEGNGTLKPAQAYYTLVVIRNYNLWMGDERVTSQNMNSLLGDGDETTAPSVYFDGDHTLVLNNANIPQGLRSTLDSLTLFVMGNDTINGGSLAAVSGRGDLIIKTDANYPGTLALTSEANSVITGFSQMVFQQSLAVIVPEKSTYDKQQLLNGDGQPVTAATIGFFIKPFVEDVVVEFENENFVTTNEETGEEVDVDLSNIVIYDILYTLNTEGDEQHIDGFVQDEDENESYIVLNTVMDPEKVEDIVNENVPGTTEYAEEYYGLTFMVPAGEGSIFIDVQTNQGHTLQVKIGDQDVQEFNCETREKVEIPYSCDEPTYVYVYNIGVREVEPARWAAPWYDIRRIGKKTTTHVKIYSVSISPSNVQQSSSSIEAIVPAFPIDGLPTEEPDPVAPVIPDVHTGISTTGTAVATAPHWHNLQGQRVQSPSQSGIYMQGGRKLIVK